MTRPTDADHYKLYPGLALKIGAILVRVEEELKSDWSEGVDPKLAHMLADPDVQAWLAYLKPNMRPVDKGVDSLP